MKYYHGLVQTAALSESDQEAVRLCNQASEVIRELKGIITVSRAFGEAPAILVVGLPEEVVVTPDELIGGVTFTRYQQQ